MSGRNISFFMGCCLAILALYSSQVSAEKNDFFFKRLLMPGELVEKHAEYEQECSRCHGGNEPMSQTRLCLDCHEEVASDIEQSRGMHGRTAGISDQECRVCHSDHLGRQGDIVKMDKDNFDHQTTDFHLTGQHAEAVCSGCHLSNKKYREAPSQCFSCHEPDDRHNGAFGKKCQDCHSTKTWSKTTFDHDKTDFPLLGQHQKTQCNTCHPNEKYQAILTSCVSCHGLNDIHGGVNGDKCQKCHRASSWEKISFDHNKDTDFSLRGGHKGLSCRACHKQSGFEEKLKTDCFSCHKNDDEHNGQNGRKCQSCHRVNRWSDIAFDHDRDTDFKLSGGHASLACEGCHHDGSAGKKLGTSCIDCHRVDDVHQGGQGRECQNCHNSKDWLNKVRFNHELTSFPLIGMHAVSSCDKCHGTKKFSDANSRCVDCHREDDSHNGSLGSECGSCHNPNDWQLWIFNHNTQTDFQLEGAHENLSCGECHIKPVKSQIQQASDCGSCHLNDDVHNRQFGRACERCHTSESFKDIRIQ